MEKEQTIRTWHQTFDFDSLMHEARKHITALAGKAWTDHNGSDPGITMLEVLAFCIADMSFRTSFDVKDILAGYNGGKQLSIDLPLADVALPNHPVTIKDLRKVLIDMTHPEKLLDTDSPNELLIRNAFPVVWNSSEIPLNALVYEENAVVSTEKPKEKPIEVSTEVPVEGENLSNTIVVLQETGNSTIEANPIKEERIHLNGLYKLQIEFEDDRKELLASELSHLKYLNQNYFEDTVLVHGEEFTISVLFPYWDEIDWSLKDADFSTIQYAKRGENGTEDYFIAVDKLSYDDYFYEYFAQLKIAGQTLDANIKIKSKIRSSITVNGSAYDFSVNFLDWNELSNGVNRNYYSTDQNLTLVESEVYNVSIEGEPLTFDIRSYFSFTELGGTETEEITLLARITFDEDVEISSSDLSLVSDALQSESQSLRDIQIELEKGIYKRMGEGDASIYKAYKAKLNKIYELLYGKNGVWSHLGQYRNLCEDFAILTASRVQEVALFGKILVQPNFNVNAILAEIYFRIDQFLNPMIQFYSLSEMIEEGHQFTDLFNGPLLKHGFIKDEDLNYLKRRSTVYTSDLIRIIMDVEGVEAVEDFSISNYIDNRLIGRNVINCLNLMNSDVYKPRFSEEKTALKVCVNGKSEKIDSHSISTLYQAKIEAKKAQQISNPDGVKLQLPTGRDRKIQDYRSIQHDFPEIYGIGEYGLPIDATEERKARAKQLKAFLLPIEQLLANYLKQVAHLPELFSYNRSIDSTYAIQPLYEVPDVQPLFRGGVKSNITWDEFKQDLTNSYEISMREGESENDFLDRRNRFLNQQLARFGESFAAYSTQMLDRNKGLLDDPSNIDAYLQERANTLNRLIDDKITFAEDYPKVSGARYNTFNTTIDSMEAPEVWDNANIASYKRRLCHLLGIKNIKNEFLFGTGTGDTDVEGMHIVEHILLRPHFPDDKFLLIPNHIDDTGKKVVYASDLDPYSFKLTIVFPRNAGRFTDEKFRAFVERLIRYETPAHIVVYFRWMSSECGKEFEKNYSAWKKNVFLLNPSYFQKNDLEFHYSVGFDMDPFEVPTQFANATESFFQITNRLVETLNDPCAEVEEEPMYMRFFENGVEMTSEPYLFDVSDPAKSYEIQVHPKGSTRVGMLLNGSAHEPSELTENKIEDNHLRQPFQVRDLFDSFGSGPYNLSLVHKEQGTITKEFTIVGASPMIKLFQNGAELAREQFDLYLDEGEGHVELNDYGGMFRVEKSNGTLLFGDNIRQPSDLFQDLRLTYILEDGGGNPFTVKYELNGEVDSVQINVFLSRNPIPVEIRILSRRFSPEVSTIGILPENNVYHFIFDYAVEKHFMDIAFSRSQSFLPGTLVLIEQGGAEIEKAFPGGRNIFLREELPTGDYHATYSVDEQPVTNFELKVTNINPTFTLEDVQLENDVYSLVAVPLHPDASAYIWRLNEVYTTRRLAPAFTFDFSANEEVTIKLTMHKNDNEASFEITVSKSLLDEIILTQSGLDG